MPVLAHIFVVDQGVGGGERQQGTGSGGRRLGSAEGYEAPEQLGDTLAGEGVDSYAQRNASTRLKDDALVGAGDATTRCDKVAVAFAHARSAETEGGTIACGVFFQIQPRVARCRALIGEEPEPRFLVWAKEPCRRGRQVSGQQLQTGFAGLIG